MLQHMLQHVTTCYNTFNIKQHCAMIQRQLADPWRSTEPETTRMAPSIWAAWVVTKWCSSFQHGASRGVGHCIFNRFILIPDQELTKKIDEHSLYLMVHLLSGLRPTALAEKLQWSCSSRSLRDQDLKKLRKANKLKLVEMEWPPLSESHVCISMGSHMGTWFNPDSCQILPRATFLQSDTKHAVFEVKTFLLGLCLWKWTFWASNSRRGRSASCQSRTRRETDWWWYHLTKLGSDMNDEERSRPRGIRSNMIQLCVGCGGMFFGMIMRSYDVQYMIYVISRQDTPRSCDLQ